MNYYIKRDKDDFVLNLWQNAHQHFAFSMKRIEERHNERWEVINQGEIAEREQERKRFLEFFMVLGVLLLESGRWNALKAAFTFTQTIPPKYELLPNSLAEVIHWYFHFVDPYDNTIPFISNRYPFPNLIGLNSDQQIKDIIIKYCAVLYLRQFKAEPQYSYEKPLSLPQLPKNTRRIKSME